MNRQLIRSFFLSVLLLPALSWATPQHWIDVRSVAEHAEGNLSLAVNIPHGEIADRIAEVTTDKEAVIYLYCRSGNRAGKAKAILEGLGYRSITNVGGLEDALKLAENK